MKLAAWIGPTASFEDLVQLASVARATGAGVVLTDHCAQVDPGHPPAWDPWTALAALSTVPECAGAPLGVMAAPVPVYGTGLLRRSIETLRSVSNGPLTVGLGMGWFREDFHAVGRRMADLPSRASIVAQFMDAPDRPRHPLTEYVIAGGSTHARRLARRYSTPRNEWGFGLVPGGDPEQALHSTQALILPTDAGIGRRHIARSEMTRRPSIERPWAEILDWRDRLAPACGTLLVPDFHVRGVAARQTFLHDVLSRLKDRCHSSDGT